MASDPFPLHHAPSDLEASTAITSVTSDAMDHAAKQAADLVEGVHKSQTVASKGRRGGRKLADDAQSLPEGTAALDTVAPESDAALDNVTSQGGAVVEPEADQNLEVTGQSASDHAVVASQFPTKADEAAAVIEDGVSQPTETLARFHAKAAEAMRTNIDAAFEFWTSMMGVRSMSEAVSLNARHMRQQMEALTAQGRELTTLVQQLAAESLGGFKTLSDESK